MNCPSEQDIVAYADGELDPDACSAVEQHLASCDPCAAYVAEMRNLTSLGRASVAALPAGKPPAIRRPRPAWPRVVVATLAAAALVLVAALIAAKVMSERNDVQVVQGEQTPSDPTTAATSRSSSDPNGSVRDVPAPATPVASSTTNDELFEQWAADARRRRSPVRLVPMDAVASFRPPVDRPVTANELNPRG